MGDAPNNLMEITEYERGFSAGVHVGMQRALRMARQLLADEEQRWRNKATEARNADELPSVVSHHKGQYFGVMGCRTVLKSLAARSDSVADEYLAGWRARRHGGADE